MYVARMDIKSEDVRSQ